MNNLQSAKEAFTVLKSQEETNLEGAKKAMESTEYKHPYMTVDEAAMKSMYAYAGEVMTAPSLTASATTFADATARYDKMMRIKNEIARLQQDAAELEKQNVRSSTRVEPISPYKQTYNGQWVN